MICAGPNFCEIAKNLRKLISWRYNIEVLSSDRVLNKEHFYGKIMQKMSTKS